MPLKVSDGIGAWIKDFKKSDAPQFKGKSQEKRRDQAIAAYLDAKRGPQNEKKKGFHSDANRKAAFAKMNDESATHASADKKPENYTDEKGRQRTRMVPVKKKVDENFTFAVDVEGLPQMFMTGNSPGEVKAHLRKLVKQPSMVQSVKRVTKHDKKKAFRKKSMEEVTENRRDRLRAKLAAVGKDMKKTADELKKHTDEYNKKFGKPKKETLEYGTTAATNYAKKITPGQMAEDAQNEKLTFAKMRSGLYKTAKAMGDVQAVRKGKVKKRVARRIAGKVAGRTLSKLFNQKEGTDAPKGPESYEAQYKRRLVKTTDPEHKKKGYNWRIKGKKDSSLTKKLYKSKPNQAEFNRQMRRIAGHEFG